jgi:hypothetical protein
VALGTDHCILRGLDTGKSKSMSARASKDGYFGLGRYGNQLASTIYID